MREITPQMAKDMKEADIAVVTRPYGNEQEEGIRVKAGTRFAIDKPVGDLRVITRARFMALCRQGLVRPFDPKGERAAPSFADNRPKPTGPVSVTKKKIEPVPDIRAQSRARVPAQKKDPPAPKKVNAQAGSQIGADKLPSSSQAAPQLSSAIFRRRKKPESPASP